MVVFFALVLLLVVLIHFYLWKRLVRDATRPGKWRRAGGVVALLLMVLVPATLIGVRSGHVQWLAWPGYLWLALMFYLLVILAILEIPRLAVILWLRRGSTRATASSVHRQDSATDETQAEGLDAVPRTSTTTQPAQAAHAGDAANPQTTTADAPETWPATTVAANAATSPRRAATQPKTTDPAETQPPASAGEAAKGGMPGETGNGGKVDQAAKGEMPAETRNGGKTGETAKREMPAETGNGGKTGETAKGEIPAETAKGEMPGETGNGGKAGEAAQGGMDRRLLLARGAAIFAGLTAAGITGYGVKTALGPPQVNRVQIPLAKLPRSLDGMRFAVVSDIHLGPLTGDNHVPRIVSLINGLNADVVCIVGDLVDGTVQELGRFARPLSDIRSKQGAYFVTGNHEYYSGFQPWIDELTALGVRPLRNERLELGGLDLAGVNDVGGVDFGDGPDFGKALGDRDPARPVVLLAHQPVVAWDAARYGVDLQLSGHTHGGQMVPFNLLVKLQQPVVSGLGEVDGVPVFVTNGAGFWGPPVRVGAPPQVTLVELRTP